MQTHRQITRKKARMWQLGAAALICAAVGAAILPVERLLTASPSRISTETPPIAVEAPPTTVSVNTSDMGRILASVGNTPAPLPPPTPEPPIQPVGGDAPPPPPPAGPAQWQYIGSIITPSSRHAVVKIGEDRKLLKQGAALEGTEIVLVEPDRLTIKRDGTQRALAIENRLKQWPDEPPKRPVAFRTPGPGAMAGRPGPSNVPQTFEQTQAQSRARALADAAKRGAQSPPPMPPPNFNMAKGGAQNDAVRMLQEQSEVNDDSYQALEQLGIGPGTSYDDAVSALKGAGIEIVDHVEKAVRENVYRTPTGVDEALMPIYQKLDPADRAAFTKIPPESRGEFLKNKASGK